MFIVSLVAVWNVDDSHVACWGELLLPGHWVKTATVSGLLEGP